MRNKLILLSTVSFGLLLGACSNDGNYGSLMDKADAAMADLEVDQAIKYYEEILEMNPEDFEYGYSRQTITQELLYSAESFKEQIDYLQGITDEAIAASKDIEFTPENAEAIAAAYDTINNALVQTEAYPSTQMYKDLAELESKFVKETEENVVQALIDEIDKNMEGLEFDVASSNVSILQTIQYSLPDLVAEETVQSYFETIESQQARYVMFPTSYTKRNEVLFENDQLGKIEFLGEGYKENELTAFFKIEGDLRYGIEDHLDIQTRYIFDDGEYTEKNALSLYYYEDYVIATQYITDNSERSIKRLDYKLSFIEQEDYKQIPFKSTDGEDKIPALLSVEDEKTIATSIVIEDEDKTFNITGMVVDTHYIILQGQITAKKDITINETTYLSVPFNNNISREGVSGEYFGGIATDFEIRYDTKNLTDNIPFAIFDLFKEVVTVDLKTGELYKGGTTALVNHIAYNIGLNFYETYNGNTFYQDVAGVSYANSVVLSDDYWNDELGKIEYSLSQKYDTLKVDVGVVKDTATDGHGSSVVTILGDGNVLKTITLGANQKTIPVELNVSNLNTLEISLEQTAGNDGSQQVLLGNGMLKANNN